MSERICTGGRIAIRYTAILAALATVACSDIMSPKEISGLYVLELYSGATLPADCPVGNITGFAHRCTILADTIRIHDDGTATFGREHRLLTELRPDGEVTRTAPSGYQTFDYTIRKDVILLIGRPPTLPAFNLAPASRSIPVPQEPSLLSYIIPQFDARLAGDILTLQDKSRPDVVRTFRRVDTAS